MISEEDEAEVDADSQLENKSFIVCNICSRRFVSKSEMLLHVRSAHFGMKENNQPSLEVIQLDIDDKLDDKLSNDSDDEMTIDSDSVCQLCYCIFKDSTDLEAHIKLAHSVPSSKCHTDSDPVNQPNASVERVETSNLENITEGCEAQSTVDVTGSNQENLTAESETNVIASPDSVAVAPNCGNNEVTSLHDTVQNIPKTTDHSIEEKVPQIDENSCITLSDENVSDDTSNPGGKKVHKRVVCNICVQEFETKETLNVHIKSDHFGIASYKCAMCSKSFESRDQVIKHYNNCNGENQVENHAKNQFKVDVLLTEGLKKVVEHKPKDTSSSKKLAKRILKAKKRSTARKKLKKAASNKSNRTSARIAEKEKASSEQKIAINTESMPQTTTHQISKLRKRNPSQMSNRGEVKIGKTKGKKTDNKRRGRKRKSDELTGQKRKRLVTEISNIPKDQSRKENILCSQNINVQTIGYENLRPCYICGQRFYSTNNELDHMIKKHSVYEKPPISQLSLLPLKPDEKFKCLRCGKVGVLSVIQCHLQEKCLRSPFSGVVPLTDFYCTVCGEHFDQALLHDIHVASVHYSHLYGQDSEHYASIPFPHILLYHISPKVCQHCGKNCQFTIKSKTAMEQAFLQQVSCIEGPYVCPYAHTTKQSRCTLDLLLHHLKFCAYRAGVLALQCNNCFKMLLCNNTHGQIDQLREIVKMDFLECCPKTQKTFKCYCCTYDYAWSVVTGQLKASIKRLDHVRAYPANDTKVQRILALNPSVHTKGPQLIAKRANAMTNSHNSVPPSDHGSDNKSTKLPLREKINSKPVQRKTSFDVVESNLAQVQQNSLHVDEATKSVATEKSAAEINQTWSTPIIPPTKYLLVPVEPIKIKNSFKPSELPKTTPIFNKAAQIANLDSCSGSMPPLTSNIAPSPDDSSSGSPVMPSMNANVEIGQELAKKRVPLARTPILKKVHPHIIEETVLLHENKIQPAMKFSQTKENSLAQNFPDHTKKDVVECKGDVSGKKPSTTGGQVSDSNQCVKICMICYNAKPHQSSESQEQFVFYTEKSFHNHMMMKHQKEINENRGNSIEPSKAKRKSIKQISSAPASDKNLIRKSGVSNENNQLKKTPERVKAPPTLKTSTCEICVSQSSTKPVYYNKASLAIHMMEHSMHMEPRQEFICYDCDTKFTDQSYWKRHIRIQHPYCVILQCDYKDCTKEFQRPQDLQDHIFSEHSHTFGCAFCFDTFTSEEELKYHSYVLHGVA